MEEYLSGLKRSKVKPPLPRKIHLKDFYDYPKILEKLLTFLREYESAGTEVTDQIEDELSSDLLTVPGELPPFDLNKCLKRPSLYYDPPPPKEGIEKLETLKAQKRSKPIRKVARIRKDYYCKIEKEEEDNEDEIIGGKLEEKGKVKEEGSSRSAAAVAADDDTNILELKKERDEDELEEDEQEEEEQEEEEDKDDSEEEDKDDSEEDKNEEDDDEEEEDEEDDEEGELVITQKEYNPTDCARSNVSDDTPDLEESELLITVQVYAPFPTSMKQKKWKRKPKFHHEILILGSQTLMDLRKQIICINDFQCTDGDVSNNPDAPKGDFFMEAYPSSMLFIDNMFYIDKSQDCDYSQIVKEWAASKNIPVKQETENMAETKICDLSLRFGFPYLYQHIGGCEHLIVFVSGRLMNYNKSKLLKPYPRYSRLAKVQGKMCFICKKSIPSWVVADYSRLPTYYTKLCTVCFKGYCYKDGEKIGSFKAFRYFDQRALVSSLVS